VVVVTEVCFLLYFSARMASTLNRMSSYTLIKLRNVQHSLIGIGCVINAVN